MPHGYHRLSSVAITLVVSVIAISCGEDPTPPPSTGTLEITTATGGVEPDADGYAVQVGTGAAQAINASGTVTSAEIDPGTYTVQLTGIAANCTVAGDNPRNVTVTAGETTTVAFTITCAATTGSLSISQSTSGWPADPDGYRLTLDGVDQGPVAVNESITIEGLPVGEHAVSLSGVAGNCRVVGDNPQTVTVPPGGSLTVSFTVTCDAVSGSVRVSSATSGPAPDADGYTISLDGADRGVLDADATVTLSGLTPGNHVIGLGGLAANCQIEGENRRSVTVAPGTTPSIEYSIACAPPPPVSGTLRVTTVTSDPDPDVAGYGLVVDGGPSRPIGANASSTLTNIAAGAHNVRLTDVPATCTVQGASPAAVTITAGATTELTFNVACSTTTGSVLVSVVSSGEPADPDGYVASLDGAPGQPLATNGNVRFSTVPAGSHTIALSGLATTCHVSGGPSREITVAVGATAEASFVVTCSATTGTIQVTTATGGTSPDPDGYTLSIDGGTVQPIGPAATVAVPDLPPGDHTVALAGIAANCTLEGENPRTVVVTGDATAPADFAVTCSTILGSLQITASTGGSSPDPDGYSLIVDGGAPVAVGSNGTVPVEGLLVGAHTVELSGVAGNCHVDGENPRTVDVVAGGTPVAFTVNCLGSDALIAFFSNARNLGAIFVINPNGTGLRNLTPTGAFEYNPVWSPNGRSLLFARDADLYVMNAQGSARLKLVDGQSGISQQRWSPDGRMIAYVNGRPEGEGTVEELWVMRSDGSGKLRLAENATEPSWSPDGSRLAYVTVQLTHIHVRVINVDGTGDVALTDRTSFQPAWSPDGSRIAFVTLGGKQMFLVNPDGTGEVSVTPPGTEDDGPAWSPDGTRIAFHTGVPGADSDIAVMNADGTGRVNLTNRAGFDLSPAWSPDGSRIAYHQSDLVDSEIYIMNADGSAKTNLSKRPTTLESTPAWGGEGRQLIASRGASVRAQSVYGRWLKAQGLRD
jgi:Tol biopolymer transport system component